MTIPAATQFANFTHSPISASVTAARPRRLIDLDSTDSSGYPSTTSAEVINAVERYEPSGRPTGWEHIKPFVRQIAATAASEASDAARLMIVLNAFVRWAVTEEGLPMTVEGLFTRRVIDAYCAESPTSEGTRATYRSKLVAVAEALNPGGMPRRLEPIARRTIQPPYSPAEMAEFMSWANGQRTDLKRRKARLMLALCAGAGLRAGELDLLRSDVTVDTQGILLNIRSGESPREVPLLRQWEGWVAAELAGLTHDAPLWMSDVQRKNKSLLNGFTDKTTGKSPNGTRLRATWIVTHLAAGTPIKELMRAAGMTQFNNLHHYLAYVDNVGELAYRSELRGSVDE